MTSWNSSSIAISKVKVIEDLLRERFFKRSQLTNVVRNVYDFIGAASLLTDVNRNDAIVQLMRQKNPERRKRKGEVVIESLGIGLLVAVIECELLTELPLLS